ncbi:hypothetical protein [Sphingomonas bacterium]|uniref:hypothetical protein n=1 Tax=Sphingomonas bacterium TaxID=1895847 RepID=UPI001575C212|nr:hypothetical protein [Sphingomonas bacterium]
MPPPLLALAGMAPPPTRARVADRGPLILAFDAAGYQRRDEQPPPRRPERRRVSPAARAWSWIMVGLLIATFVLPFSLAALVDIVQYLER